MIRRAMNAGEMPDESNAREALLAALEDVPDVEPFSDSEAPGRHTFVHSPCWALADADPAMKGIKGSIWDDIESGECDCRTPGPWRRIYVLKAEA